MGIIQHSNKSSEWYTPSWILDAARDVLGPIDLDPATSPKANYEVMAARVNGPGFEQPTNGLEHYWSEPVQGEQRPCTIWLNPPSPAIVWWSKLIHELELGHVKHALFLAYNVQLAQVSQGKGIPSILDFPVCWFSKRIRFVGAGNSPANASALVYVPGTIDRTEQFMLSFSQYGTITKPAWIH